MNDLISRKALIKSIQGTVSEVAKSAPYDPVWFTRLAQRQFEILNIIDDAPAVNPIPVKIGDTAWVICNHKGNKKPKKGVVSEMYYTDDMSLCIVVKFVRRGTWGKEVFGTAEEAWAAIGGNNENF